MAEILHQLRLVVCPIIVRLYTSQVGFLAGFQPSTVSPLNLPTNLSFTKKKIQLPLLPTNISPERSMFWRPLFSFWWYHLFRCELAVSPKTTYLFDILPPTQHDPVGCFPSFPPRKSHPRSESKKTRKPSLGTQTQTLNHLFLKDILSFLGYLGFLFHMSVLQFA